MSRSIEVSPKHGVNATIPCCFFCGKEKNEIALMGRIRERDKTTGKAVPGSDIEAPRKMVIDYEPCDECREGMSRGVTLIGVTLTQPSDGRPPLTAQRGEKVYPSGRWCVLTTEAAQRMFNVTTKPFDKGDKLFIEDDVLARMTGDTES